MELPKINETYIFALITLQLILNWVDKRANGGIKEIKEILKDIEKKLDDRL